jgi:hypothetical protein
MTAMAKIRVKPGPASPRWWEQYDLPEHDPDDPFAEEGSEDFCSCGVYWYTCHLRGEHGHQRIRRGKWVDNRVRLSIDGAAGGTGIALWPESTWGQLTLPCLVQNIYPAGKVTHWREKTFTVLDKMEKAIQPYQITHAYLEQPEFFDDAGGHLAAKSDDLIKLVFFFGACCQVLYRLRIPMTFYKVKLWKGQLPKKVVERRIRALLPEIDSLNVSSHGFDAVGIGLYAKGQINQ